MFCHSVDPIRLGRSRAPHDQNGIPAHRKRPGIQHVSCIQRKRGFGMSAIQPVTRPRHVRVARKGRQTRGISLAIMHASCSWRSLFWPKQGESVRHRKPRLHARAPVPCPTNTRSACEASARQDTFQHDRKRFTPPLQIFGGDRSPGSPTHA